MMTDAKYEKGQKGDYDCAHNGNDANLCGKKR